MAQISMFQLSGSPPAQTPDDLGTGASDTGNLFRVDPTSSQYIFNLDTRVLAAGVWRIDVNLGDGSTQSVQIGLR